MQIEAEPKNFQKLKNFSDAILTVKLMKNKSILGILFKEKMVIYRMIGRLEKILEIKEN